MRLFLSLSFVFCAALAASLASAETDKSLPVTQGQLNRVRPVLAVLPFNDANARAKEYGYGTTLSAMLVTEMRNHSNFTVLERSKIAEVLGAQTLSSLGITQRQIRQLEAAYKAEVVLTGDVAYLDGGLEVDARLISTGTGEVVAAASGHSGADKDLRALVQLLSGTIEKKYLRQWMGSITVASQPVEAEVFLNGDFVGKANPNSILRLDDLLGGRYRLELVAAGYQSWIDTVGVSPKTQVSINASLTALPGNLVVNSQPVDAAIFLDGKPMGKTPREIKNVAEGEHHLRVELANFYPSEEKVFVNRGQSTQSNVQLKIKMGFLDVSTLPAGSSVSVNGRFFGKTPLKVDKVEPGKVSVEISSGGYRPFQETYSVKPSDTIIIKEDLKLQTGLLTVVSTPRVVRVRLDDGGTIRDLGRTPVVKESLNIGHYKLLLDMDDYYSKETPIDIVTDEETREEVKLDQKPGHLQIVSEPHTEILVDGAFRGYTPADPVALPEGEYTVTLNSFHGTSIGKVSVSADHDTALHRGFAKSKTYLLGALFFVASMGALIAL
ncbi:MAG: PEGA domain-containing protein [Fibrobacteres bacterium]|nr:PEGA domain-containing protein [Fibrobacterota bacterium]